MTTGSYSNYASVFQFPSGTAYAALVVDYPEVKTGAIEITNNQSSGVREYIYDGLVGLTEFTISLLGMPGIFATFKGHETSKTIGLCVLTDPVETHLFSGLITSVKKEKADQQNPDATKITITVQPTGALS